MSLLLTSVPRKMGKFHLLIFLPYSYTDKGTASYRELYFQMVLPSFTHLLYGEFYALGEEILLVFTFGIGYLQQTFPAAVVQNKTSFYYTV